MKKKVVFICCSIVFIIGAAGLLGWKYVTNLTFEEIFPYVQPEYTQLEHKGIVFHYHPDNQELIEPMLESYEAMQPALIEWFGEEIIAGLPSLPVFIMREDDLMGSQFFDREYEKEGLYSVVQQFVLIKAASEQKIERIFVHEYAHFVTHQFMLSHNSDIIGIPDWFIEGLAVAFEQMQSEEIFMFKLLDYQAVSFKEIEVANEASDMESLYAQGLFAIADLIHQFGFPIVQQLLNDTSETNDFNATFEELTGISLNSYHERFLYEPEGIYALQLFSDQQDVFKEKALAYLTERGTYFPYGETIYNHLMFLYSKEGNLEQAMKMGEKLLQYRATPADYMNVAEFAASVDAEKAKLYADQAVEAAIIYEWSVEVFEAKRKALMDAL